MNHIDELNIKRKLFNRAVNSVKRYCSLREDDELLSCNVSAALDEIKKESNTLCSQLALTSRNHKDIEDLQSKYETLILQKVRDWIQLNILDGQYKEITEIENTLNQCADLRQRICRDFDSIIKISAHNQYDTFHNDCVIITPDENHPENQPIKLNSNKCCFVTSANRRKRVIQINKPNLLVWLFIQLQDAGVDMCSNRYIIYGNLASCANLFLLSHKSINNQNLLLTCLDRAISVIQSSKDIHVNLMHAFNN